MGTVIVLTCMAVTSFTILVQPAVAQGASTTFPLNYPAQVLQGDGSQTCPSEELLEILRSEVENATYTLFGESVVPILQGNTFSCGGTTGWRRVAYLNMSDSSQRCPSAWRDYSTPFRVCGRRSYSVGRGSCQGLNYT